MEIPSFFPLLFNAPVQVQRPRRRATPFLALFSFLSCRTIICALFESGDAVTDEKFLGRPALFNFPLLLERRKKCEIFTHSNDDDDRRAFSSISYAPYIKSLRFFLFLSFFHSLARRVPASSIYDDSHGVFLAESRCF